MCGIFAVCHCPDGQQSLTCERFSIEEAKKCSSLQSHRGPDFRGCYQDALTGDILCHERLAIVDLTCVHPLQGSGPTHWVIHNGEIYNHKAIRENELHGLPLRTTCDSEVLIWLAEQMLPRGEAGALCSLLDGVFAFALISDGRFLAARDPIGVKQMYYGIDPKGRYFFSNEMKTFERLCGDTKVAIFPPGHYFAPGEGFVRYYQPLWFDYRLATRPADEVLLRETLIAATIKRLMSDAPLGVLLSGGLDSSLVSSIASREMKRLGLPLKSFSIGLPGESTDLLAARQVAKFLGTDHYEFHFTFEEGVKNLEKLVWHLETYDVTSIRASTPMFFMAKKIRELGVKVVLSGEGSDEIFGGYLYFHHAPNDEEFQKETIDRVTHLFTADCLRADKSTMAHGVEVRVPFLDKAFLDVAMLTVPTAKRPFLRNGKPAEKFLIRKAFDIPMNETELLQEDPYLPENILWRQKEQFSDGVGYSWIEKLIDFCAKKVSDEDYAKRAELFPFNTPKSKEAFYMRTLFHKHFPSEEAAKTVRRWIPKWQTNEDPSGRANNIHVDTTESPASRTAPLEHPLQISPRPQCA